MQVKLSVKLVILFLISCIGCTIGVENIGNVGKCPYNTPNIDLNNMSGMWYYTYGNYNPYEPKDRCPQIEIFKTRPTKIYVIKTSLAQNGSPYKVYENCEKIGQTGFLEVTYSSLDADQYVMVTSLTPQYYTLVYCSKNNKYVGTQAEILTRARNPNPAVISSAKADLQKFGINTTNFRKYNQTDCFSVPELDTYSSSELSKMTF